MKLKTMHGWAILLLSLFIYVMWGIQLFSVSRQEEERLEFNLPPQSSGSSAETRTIKPHPFLYFYLQEINFKPELIPGVPPEDGVLVVVGPRDDLDRETQKAILRWVQRGGRMLLFSSRDHYLVKLLGGNFRTISEGGGKIPLQRPGYDDVRSLTARDRGITPLPGATFVPHSQSDDGLMLAAVRYLGQGRTIVVGNPDWVFSEGLERRDNVIYVTRLVEELRGNGQVWFHDPNVGVQINVAMRGGQNIPPQRRNVEVDDASLLGLLKANPISLVLVQLLIGLLIYFHALGRNLSRPLPLSIQDPPPIRLETAIARLYQNHQASDHAARRLLKDLQRDLRRRFSLPAETDLQGCLEVLRRHDPDLGKAADAAVRILYPIATGADPEGLVRAAHHLQTLRREGSPYA